MFWKLPALGNINEAEATEVDDWKKERRNFSPLIWLLSLVALLWKWGKNINQKYQFSIRVAGASVWQSDVKWAAKDSEFASNSVAGL